MTAAIMLFLFMANRADSQFHLGSYSFTAVGIGGPVTDRINLEGKIFANRAFSDLGLEGIVSFELNPGSFHQFSVGAGFNIDLFLDTNVDLLFPVELEIYPLTSFRRIALLIEVAPVLDIEADDLLLRHMWGVRYYFREPV
jgi:hypothetical protein